MTGHPLLDFIMFDQFFNGDNKSSGGSPGGGNDGGKWALRISVAIFVIIIIYGLIKEFT